MADEIEEMVKPVPSNEEVVEEKATEEPVKVAETVIEDESSDDNVVVVEEESTKEPVEEPAKEPVEEPAVEEAEEDKPEDKPEVEPEDDNAKKIDERLSIISEVRQELANVYKTHQTDAKTMESLQSQIRSLESKNRDSNKRVEQLTSEVVNFKSKEDEANKVSYTKRLEQLSGNFSRLGQDKSVEQLSSLSEEIIEEFESVTNMALDYKSEEKLNSVTTPTQSIPHVEMAKVEKVTEKISDHDFMKGVLNTLAGQQNKQNGDGKRILNM